MKLMFGGGLNENQFPSIHEAFIGSQNFALQKDASHLSPRPCFDLKGTATNAGDIRGLLQLVKRDDTQSTLVQAGNTVYEWDGDASFTSRGSCNASSQLRDAYWSLGDYLVISDLQKLTVVKTWNGTTFATLTTGLGTDLYAKYAIVHRGRVWLFNVTAGSDTPHMLVASEFEDPTSYDTTVRALDSGLSTGLEAFYMLTPDLRPINGAVLFHGDLIISTLEGRLYKLTGTDAKSYAWADFYTGSQAVGTESLVNTGNDVMYMKRGGAIESLRATQEYGDTAADDLSRWIPETVKNLTGAISVYDQQGQKVLFFVSGKVLVLFKDILLGGAVVDEQGRKEKLSPWSVYTTNDASGFNCSAARYMRMPGTTNYNVYFGSSDGRIFALNGEGNGDGGSSDIQLIRTTRYVESKLNHIMRATIQHRRIAEVVFNITLDWGDEYNESTASIPLKGPPVDDTGVFYGAEVYFGGDFYYGAGFAFARKISHQNCDWVGKGPGCFITMTALTTQPYQVDNVDLV